MRIGDRNHADGIAAPKGGYARKRAAVVPVQGKLICHDEVDNAASQSHKDRVIGGGTTDFAWAVGSLEFDTALAEVPDSFRPNARPEVVKLVRQAVRPGIHNSMNRYSQRPLRLGADRRGYCCPEEIPPRHSQAPEPSFYR